MSSKISRVDREFDSKLRDIMNDRQAKRLTRFTPRDTGLAEGTRLVLRCPSWPNVEKELRSLPKKR